MVLNEKKGAKRRGLTFEDISIVPAYSTILPGDIDVSTSLTRSIKLNIPIVSAAMDSVTESTMAIRMAQNGGIGIIHHYLSTERQIEEIKKVKRYESWIIDHPFTIRPDESVGAVRELMSEHNISGIPVIDKEKLVGIITKRDIRFVSDETRKVKDLMTTKLITVTKDISRDEARNILHENKIEKILIVDNKGVLEGLITVKDILKKEQFPNATRDGMGRLRVGAAVGVNDFTRVKMLIKADVDVLVIDSAHGHSKKVIESLKKIKKDFDIPVIAGNVVTGEGAADLISSGADCVKVGIGAGSICTTRVVTGVGVPQVTAIEQCVEVTEKEGIPLISDGGIREYGDIAKAIAAGANAVMIGSLLAGTEESPGKKFVLEGRLFKEYRGMGSEGALENRYGTSRYMKDPKGKIIPEGVEGIVNYVGSVSDVLADMVGGLKHAMGYAGCATIQEFRTKSSLVEISLGGQREAHPSVRISKEPRNYRRSHREFLFT